MTNDDFDNKWGKIYNERIENSHDAPSPETRERLAILETTQKLFMEENTKEHAEIMKSLVEFHTSTNLALQEITLKIDNALEKKANKWTERAIVGFVIFVLTGLGGYIGSLIYKAIIHIG